MNERVTPKDNRPVDPASWPASNSSIPIDPVTGATAKDPLTNERRPADPDIRPSRMKWPLLIAALAAVVIAVLIWLPAEMSTDQANDKVDPATNTPQITSPTLDKATPETTTSGTAATTQPTPDTQPAPATGTAGQTPATSNTAQPAPAAGATQQN